MELSPIPTWILLAQSVSFGVFTLLVTIVIAAVFLLRPFLKLRNLKDAHWTELARQGWEVRVTLNFMVIMFAVMIPAWTVMRTKGEPAWVYSLTCILGLFGAGLVYRLIANMLPKSELKPVSRMEFWRGWLNVFILYLPGLVLAAVFLMVFPQQLVWQAPVFALFTVAYYFAVEKIFGIGIGKSIGSVSDNVPQYIRNVVQKQAMAENIPVPNIVILSFPTINAFAWITNHTIGVTKRMLTHMSEQEITAIVAHEVGHLTDDKRHVRAFRLMVWLPYFAAVAYVFGKSLGLHPLVVLGGVVVGLLFARSMLGGVRRKMEEHADGAAHEHCDQVAYAKALERLYQLTMTPAVLGNKRAAHPDLYDRLLACGYEPNYPRPQPPNRHLSFGLTIGFFLLLVLPFTAMFAAGKLMERQLAAEKIPTAMAVFGPQEGLVRRLAELAQEDGEYQRGGDLFLHASKKARRLNEADIMRSLSLYLSVRACGKASAAWQKLPETTRQEEAYESFGESVAVCKSMGH